jgi:hypothetical protein
MRWQSKVHSTSPPSPRKPFLLKIAPDAEPSLASISHKAGDGLAKAIKEDWPLLFGRASLALSNGL